MSGFKVIIVGAGPAGLTLAHCLGLAGVDYLLLERRKTLIDQGGSTITLSPEGTRVLDQIGLLESARDNSQRLQEIFEYGWDGEFVRTRRALIVQQENHAYPVLMFSRPTLLKVLSQTLPESKIRVGVDLDSVAMTDAGVDVRLTDGSSERGSVIVGADGVHSALRRLLVERDTDALNGQASFTQHDFKLLYGRSSASPQLQKTIGSFLIRHGKGWFLQMGCEDSVVYWGLYEMQEGPPSPTSGRGGFTAEETAEFAEKYRRVVCMAELGLTVGDLWDERSVGFLDWMDEGVAERWFHDRAVFIGDAAVKPNPSRAQGANVAMESAVALTNELYTLLKSGPEPTGSDLTLAFERYQSTREPKMRTYVEQSKRNVRMDCWTDWHARAVWNTLTFLESVQSSFTADLLMAPWTRRSSRLDCVADKGLDSTARVPWADLRVSPKLEGTLWTGLGMAFWALLGWRPVWTSG